MIFNETPSQSRTKVQSQPKLNKENAKSAFNTRGYFDSSQPYDEQYLLAKQKVFHKYREQQDGIIMMDITNIRAPLIQRGYIKPTHPQQHKETKAYLDKATNSLVKHYFMRKERRQLRNNECFGDPPNIKAELLHLKTNQSLALYSQSISSRVTKSTQLKMSKAEDDIA